MSEFAHLHVHTDASKIDGLGPVASMLAAAKERGFKSLAMTDHGSLANTVSFIAAAEANGIKPIIGVEGYLAIDGEINHITLLGDGNRGLNSLIALNNLGHASSNTRPAFTVDQLKQNADGITLLTGCIASPFQRMPLNDAIFLAKTLKSAFDDRIFAEIMFVIEGDSWERSVKLSEALKLPLVATNDVHFAYPELAPIHTILTNMKAGFEYNSKHLYLALEDELMNRASKIGPAAVDAARRGIKNAGRLAGLLTPPTLSSAPTLPHIKDAAAELKRRIIKGTECKARTPAEYDAFRVRALYEYDIIVKMGYETYFLILEDIVSYSKRNGIRVGPGRGSGAGSLVLYLLGITDINPLEYDLSFERFLNPEREGMPDVDVDFCSVRRGETIDYTVQRWGATPVATYSRYSHKMLVHDLAKQLRLPRDLEQKAADEGPESEAFKDLCSREPRFRQAYDAIDGQIRHVGQHAGGVIITNAPIPIERAADNETLVAAWTEGEDRQLTRVGVVKYDLLGLSALTVLDNLEKTFSCHADDPKADDPVFDIFREGRLTGIFQFSGSHGIVEYTKKVAPSTFGDLVAINALYRPGALDVGTAQHYPEWKTNPRLIHPLIDPILAETYGVIVYQEQVMRIFATITSGSLGDADLARRVIVKSKRGDPAWEKKMKSLLATFMRKGKANGIPITTLEQLWEEMSAHARYSFNKAHAVSYARIAWELAWWKHHHPAHFYAECMNADPGDAAQYLLAAAMQGIDIIPPHVNISDSKWRVKGDKIYIPLSSIKFLGEAGAKTISKNAPYDSFEDFMARIPKKLVRSNVRTAMLKLEAFSGITGDVNVLLATNKLDSLSRSELEREALGFLIPTKSIMDKIELARKGGFVAGIITAIKKKTSSYGDYHVYSLQPSGAFWIRGPKQYDVAEVVAAKVSKNTGKAKETWRL